MPYKLKNSTGKRYTKQLFYEPWINMEKDKRLEDVPPFTLHAIRPGAVCFGKLYVELGDPTGYEITQRLLNGDYGHWLMLMKCSWFLEAKSAWDVELDAKLTSEGLRKIREVASSDDKSSLAAARYLANKDYRKETKSGRGRPTTEEVEGELKREAAEEKILHDDLKRISLVKA